MEIAFVGDVMLGRLVNGELRTADPAYPWGDTLSILRRADARVANLECVLADDGRPWPAKVFHFRSDRKNVASLKIADLTAVSLANNHVLDFGDAALLEMLSTLARNSILHAGAGKNLEAARRPARWSSGGTTVGLLAFTDNEPDWEATAVSPGVFHLPIDGDDGRVEELLDLVRRLRREVQLVIVSAHWGGNWGIDPPAEHRALARSLVDAGADVVFGHSAHIVRGVEVYRNRPIIYSAGDFVDDYAIDPFDRNDQSFIFLLETRGGVPHELRLYPTLIVDLQARMAGPAARAIAERMRRLCITLGTRSTWRDADDCLVIPIEVGMPEDSGE